jgi:hypothetical protein
LHHHNRPATLAKYKLRDVTDHWQFASSRSLTIAASAATNASLSGRFNKWARARLCVSNEFGDCA